MSYKLHRTIHNWSYKYSLYVQLVACAIKSALLYIEIALRNVRITLSNRYMCATDILFTKTRGYKIFQDLLTYDLFAAHECQSGLQTAWRSRKDEKDPRSQRPASLLGSPCTWSTYKDHWSPWTHSRCIKEEVILYIDKLFYILSVSIWSLNILINE